MAIGKTRRRRHKVSGKGKSKTARRAVIVVSKTRRRRHHVSGTAVGSSIGKTRKKLRKSGFLGSTGASSSLMQVAEMAVGVGVGAAATHMLLRPVEHKLAAKYPMATKFMGAAEIILGGFIALKGKKKFVQSVGIGILAGGVHTVMKQTNIGLNSPAEGSKMGEYTHLNVPINGPLQDQINGLIENGGNRYVKTPVVGQVGLIKDEPRRQVYTPTVGDPSEGFGKSQLTDEEREYLYTPRGM